MSKVNKGALSRLWYFGVLFQFLCVNERWNIRRYHYYLLEIFEGNVVMMEVRMTTHHHNPFLCPIITLSYVHTLAGVVYRY